MCNESLERVVRAKNESANEERERAEESGCVATILYTRADIQIEINHVQGNLMKRRAVERWERRERSTDRKKIEVEKLWPPTAGLRLTALELCLPFWLARPRPSAPISTTLTKHRHYRAIEGLLVQIRSVLRPSHPLVHNAS